MEAAEKVLKKYSDALNDSGAMGIG